MTTENTENRDFVVSSEPPVVGDFARFNEKFVTKDFFESYKIKPGQTFKVTRVEKWIGGYPDYAGRFEEAEGYDISLEGDPLGGPKSLISHSILQFSKPKQKAG